jgi:hypothetical protein
MIAGLTFPPVGQLVCAGGMLVVDTTGVCPFGVLVGVGPAVPVLQPLSITKQHEKIKRR